jgi:uncharacterized membrane protein
MSKRGNLWAVGFDDTERAAQVRDQVTKLGWERHDLILLDVAVAVLYPDGSFTLNGEPLPAEAQIDGSTFTGLLGCLALAAPPLTGPAVSALLGRCADERAEVGISDDFVRVVEALIKPGTSVLFVLDNGGNMDAILYAIRGLGGTVLRTNVDLEHAKLIQSTLAAPNDSSQPSGR